MAVLGQRSIVRMADVATVIPGRSWEILRHVERLRRLDAAQHEVFAKNSLGQPSPLTSPLDFVS
jgi:hypothetical protein